MKFILAEKIAMTQKFAADGTVIPVTRVAAGPCVVTQVKTEDRDGYAAVQVGFGTKRRVFKSIAGHTKGLGSFRYLKEFRVTPEQAKTLAVGNRITAGIFQAGDVINVSGLSKGKGFQGVVKRHHFGGSPASHGHKDQLRMPGSIGSQGPQHVLKGKRMAGRMGGEQVTVTNLEVVEADVERNELYIKGAVPGATGNLLLIAGDGEFVVEVETPKEAPKVEEAPVAVPAEASVEEKPVSEETPTASDAETKKS